MIIIKIYVRIIILSFIVAMFMYPKTIGIIVSSVRDIHVAFKLSARNISDVNNKAVDNDKTKVVFMFDDGWRSVYTEAFEVFKQYNYKASVPIIAGMIGETEYLTYNELAELYLDGWDLLNHTYLHKDGMYGNGEELLSDFNRGRNWMKNRFLGDYSNMAVMPYGEINPYLLRLLKEAGYLNVRTSGNIIVLDDPRQYYYSVNCISLLTDVTSNEAIDLLEQTHNESKTAIFILHKINDIDEGLGMTYSKEKLHRIIRYIDDNSDRYTIVTYSQLF